VFEVITDLEAYPEWADGVLEATVLGRDEEGRPEKASYRVDARIVEVSYTLQYHYADDDISWELVEGDVVKQLDGIYELSDDGGGTQVRYTLEVDLDIPVPGFLKKRAAKQILDTSLKGLKQRAENR
jgi:ribosome-associated toxin RatA of RatAB toxin-antitoxin module